MTAPSLKSVLEDSPLLATLYPGKAEFAVRGATIGHNYLLLLSARWVVHDTAITQSSSTVSEPAQRIHDDRNRVFGADITDDAAHMIGSSFHPFAGPLVLNLTQPHFVERRRYGLVGIHFVAQRRRPVVELLGALRHDVDEGEFRVDVLQEAIEIAEN
jgi:hypothetical protein